ncbi:MAG: GTP-binding protein LepA, partial [Microlunatus sp.]|nr:GTP-binding protein LepA [Microlunatus sp.]
MPRQPITQQKIAEHVERLGELYPPIALDSVDRTIKNPRAVAQQYGHVIDYLARVELEVDRNVMELLCLLPDVDDTNKTFYADVWQPQEIQHGLILDRLQQDLGRPPAEPHLEVSLKIKILGSLAGLPPIQDVAKLLYFLTGASTERQAVLAYNQINTGMQRLGEAAISETIITPIKQQEPGHFAFYQMSAS